MRQFRNLKRCEFEKAERATSGRRRCMLMPDWGSNGMDCGLLEPGLCSCCRNRSKKEKVEAVKPPVPVQAEPQQVLSRIPTSSDKLSPALFVRHWRKS